MNEQDKLRNNVNIGESLRELRNHNGWNYLCDILADMYKQNVIDLIEKDDVVIRANIKAIENLVEKINANIKLGADSAEELKQDKFKEILATPE